MMKELEIVPALMNGAYSLVGEIRLLYTHKERKRKGMK